MHLEAILFDCDGTLADTNEICALSYQKALGHYMSPPPSLAEIYAHYGPSEEGLLDSFLPEKTHLTFPIFLREYEKLLWRTKGLFPGMEEVLDELRDGGFHLAIITGKGRPAMDITSDHYRLERWFDVIRTGHRHGHGKVDHIAQILGRWGIAPAQAAYLGDTPGDMRAAHEAGVLPLGAVWGPLTELGHPTTEEAALLFPQVRAFYDWIGRLERELP